MLHMTTPVEAQAQGWIGTDDTFGARLALIRQRMGWNIAEAARECGLGTENWRLWEQAGRTPSKLVTIAMAIATRSGCDYLWLVHGPQRGGAVRTTSCGLGPRVIAVGGAEQPARIRPIGRSSIHNGPATRAVSQTRPLAGESNRPRTPQPV
jgi:transcriptional regulator with XRE-family HTH domain